MTKLAHVLPLLTLAFATAGCAITSHASHLSAVGVPRSSDDLAQIVDEPGPVTVETVHSADWAVARKGLIDLDAPAARAAGLHDGPEPIHVSFHALRHPSQGLFLIDTGVERAMRDDPSHAAIRGFVASYLDMGTMKIGMPLGDWLAAHPSERVKGVLLTHLHPDHVTGMADVPAGTTVYTGRGEAASSALLYGFLQPNTDRSLAGKPPIEELAFTPDPGHRFEGVIDLFGDRTVWAIATPGHTPGSTSYLVRTPEGPVLFTGDTSHTRWGWEHDVEPGDLTTDHGANVHSLAQLRAFVAAHPKIRVRFGHQD